MSAPASARRFPILDSGIPIYTNYFHAVSLSDETDIFSTGTNSFDLAPREDYEPYDVVKQIIAPLTNKNVLRANGNTVLVPMEGILVLPDPIVGKCPLAMIGHGNHAGYAILNYKDDPPTKDPNGQVIKGKYLISVLDRQVPSFSGYEDFQNTLAEKGIASYSINLNIVNTLENNEQKPFEKQALDFNQRILLFFMHLKLLKTIADESLASNEFPIQFLEGTVFKNIKDALQTSTHTDLIGLKTALQGKIDFTKLGFMGHSRGADAVSRIPAYFFKGATLADPSFPVNKQVSSRIKKLSEQIGRPVQDSIKCILALEPTATKNSEGDPDPDKHGYVIESPQTMYFVGVGTHDEDVTLHSVRIYEYPGSPKAMIAINGATHKRFNKVWATDTTDPDEFSKRDVSANILSIADHKEILSVVYGSCFTATLANQPSDLLFFTKERQFVINLPKTIDFQSAWKFGFPFSNPTPTVKDLDAKVTEPPSKRLKESSFAFEQDISAFLETRENAGIFSLKIPIDSSSATENLSKYTHFSFRFAKGYDLSANPDRIEEKNFTIECFENNNRVGKLVEGKDITTVQLKALPAFDEIRLSTGARDFKYSILLQTVEISFDGRFSTAELDKVNRIEIKIISDPTKSPPRPAPVRIGGSIGGAVLGGALGVGGAYVYNEKLGHPGEEDKKYIILGSGLGGAALGAGIAYIVLKSDKNAFAFTDFLLTNRQLP
jgi:hypothetical protein